MIFRKSIADEIADILQRKILELNLKEGDKLPSHEELAQELGVSKASLREGLQRLSAMGVIEIRHGFGTVVAAPQISHYLKILTPRLISRGSTLSNLFEARKCIESRTVFLAATRADAQDEKDLEAILEEMGTAVRSRDTETFLRKDAEFHAGIAKAGKNEVLHEILVLVNELLLFHENLTQQMPGGIDKAFNFHKRILRAIKERKPELASKLMEAHIDDVRSQRMTDLIIYCDTFGTGSIGGTFYSVGRALSKVINRYSWIKAKTEPTGGGVENVILAGEKRIVLGITQSDVALHAFTGTREFDTAYDNVRAVCGAHKLDLQIITLKKHQISNVEQLRGKKVVLGAPGGASQWVSLVVLKEYGIEEREVNPQYLSISNAIEALEEEKIEAIFYLSGGPSSALQAFSERAAISLVPLDPEKIHRIREDCPYWTYSEILSKTYSGQTHPVTTLGIPCILVTHKDVSEEAVYSIVKSILEHTAEIAEEHPAGSEYCLSNALRGITVPIHPGARKYFLEKGLEVTDELALLRKAYNQ